MAPFSLPTLERHLLTSTPQINSHVLFLYPAPGLASTRSCLVHSKGSPAASRVPVKPIILTEAGGILLNVHLAPLLCTGSQDIWKASQHFPGPWR